MSSADTTVGGPATALSPLPGWSGDGAVSGGPLSVSQTTQTGTPPPLPAHLAPPGPKFSPMGPSFQLRTLNSGHQIPGIEDHSFQFGHAPNFSPPPMKPKRPVVLASAVAPAPPGASSQLQAQSAVQAGSSAQSAAQTAVQTAALARQTAADTARIQREQQSQSESEKRKTAEHQKIVAQLGDRVGYVDPGGEDPNTGSVGIGSSSSLEMRERQVSGGGRGESSLLEMGAGQVPDAGAGEQADAAGDLSAGGGTGGPTEDAGLTPASNV